MPTISSINLIENKNTWILGTPDAVDVYSPGFSPSIQIKYNKEPCKKTHLKNETYHKHLENIVECYLVLNGWLKLLIENEEHCLKEREIIRVPSHHCHKVIDYSNDVEYMTIRAPASDESKKREC